jgi:uracil-DNA glycosylase
MSFSDVLYLLEKSLSNLIGNSRSLLLEDKNDELTEHFRQSFQSELNANSKKETENAENKNSTARSYHKFEKDERSNSIKEPKQITRPENSLKQPKKNLSIAEAGSVDSLRLRINDCTRCELSYGRKRIVFGQGNQNAKLMVVGDFPNEVEDQKGLILVSKEGMLLVQILQSIAISIESIYLTNIVKCKPESKKSVPDTAVYTCLKILDKQIDLIQPSLILILGSIAEKTLLPKNEIAGNTQEYRTIPVISTYHPSQLIENPDLLQKAWVDMRRIRQFLYSVSQV